MPTFLFNSVSLASIDAAKNYYIQMVSAAPAPTLTTFADLISTSVNAPMLLPNITYTNGLFAPADRLLPSQTYPSPHVGFVLVERLGAEFSPSDLLVAYSPHTNSLAQEITLAAGTYALEMDFATTGLFSVVPAWQYTIGAYIDNGSVVCDNGAIQTIGTNNNTLAYTNPATSTPVEIEIIGGPSYPNLFARQANNVALGDNNGAYEAMLHFRGDGDICFNPDGRLGWNGYSTNSGSILRLWGSNFLPQGWTEPALNAAENWTELVAHSVPASGSPAKRLSPAFSSSGVFYRYLKIGWQRGPGALIMLSNIDFYNCTLRTRYQNFN